jgi:RNA polymerase sigma-B factor
LTATATSTAPSIPSTRTHPGHTPADPAGGGPAGADPAGGGPAAGRSRDVDTDVEALAARLGATTDPTERAALLQQVTLTALPLADAIAMRYTGRGIETEDLVQVARTALVKATHRYHPGAGPGFAAYAAPTITGELKRWFRDHGWAVRPPRRIQELRAGLATEEEHLRHTLARDPADHELAAALAVTPADIAEARAAANGYHATSLDTPTPTGTPLADHLLTTDPPTTAIDLHHALQHALTTLTDRQRHILHLRYVDELTQTQIGHHIGVSQMQVSRILRTTLTQLRHHLLTDHDTTHTTAA